MYKDTNKKEKSLGNFRLDQRCATLTTERIAILDKYAKGWNKGINKVQCKSSLPWNDNLNAYIVFITEKGREPNTQSKDNSEEKRLGQWASNQRRAYRGGTLSPEKRSALETIDGWKWNILDERWNENLNAYIAFKKEFGREPNSKSKDPEEKRLGVWTVRQRKYYKKGGYPEEKINALEAIEGWEWNLR